MHTQIIYIKEINDSNLDVGHLPFLITIQNKFVVQPPNNIKELTFKKSNEDMCIWITPLNN